MTTFVLHAKDTNRLNVEANCIKFLQSLPKDKPWEVTIEKHVKEYTGKQRRSIFGAAYKALMEFSGLQGSDDKLELHRFFCGEFFGWRDGALIRRPKRTTTKDEFGRHNPISIEQGLEFYAFLQRRGAEVGCYVPDPDPFWREKAERERAVVSIRRAA